MVQVNKYLQQSHGRDGDLYAKQNKHSNCTSKCLVVMCAIDSIQSVRREPKAKRETSDVFTEMVVSTISDNGINVGLLKQKEQISQNQSTGQNSQTMSLDSLVRTLFSKYV